MGVGVLFTALLLAACVGAANHRLAELYIEEFMPLDTTQGSAVVILPVGLALVVWTLLFSAGLASFVWVARKVFQNGVTAGVLEGWRRQQGRNACLDGQKLISVNPAKCTSHESQAAVNQLKAEAQNQIDCSHAMEIHHRAVIDQLERTQAEVLKRQQEALEKAEARQAAMLAKFERLQLQSKLQMRVSEGILLDRMEKMQADLDQQLQGTHGDLMTNMQELDQRMQAFNAKLESHLQREQKKTEQAAEITAQSALSQKLDALGPQILQLLEKHHSSLEQHMTKLLKHLLRAVVFKVEELQSESALNNLGLGVMDKSEMQLKAMETQREVHQNKELAETKSDSEIMQASHPRDKTEGEVVEGTAQRVETHTEVKKSKQDGTGTSFEANVLENDAENDTDAPMHRIDCKSQNVAVTSDPLENEEGMVNEPADKEVSPHFIS